jgi:hypothetical protein
LPEKVNSQVLAGVPIDTDAGNGPIKRMAHASPISFYKELVAFGGEPTALDAAAPRADAARRTSPRGMTRGMK